MNTGRVKQFLVPAGRQVFLGAPASPMPVAKITALRELVSSIHGVIEAHLPQVFAHGMDRPAQILVLLITPAVASDAVFEALGHRLGALIGGDELSTSGCYPNGTGSSTKCAGQAVRCTATSQRRLRRKRDGAGGGCGSKAELRRDAVLLHHVAIGHLPSLDAGSFVYRVVPSRPVH